MRNMSARRAYVDGWEWPAPSSPTCGDAAEDVVTGEAFYCCLRANHRSVEHHWEKVVGSELRSCSWIATPPVTFVGGAPAFPAPSSSPEGPPDA